MHVLKETKAQDEWQVRKLESKGKTMKERMQLVFIDELPGRGIGGERMGFPLIFVWALQVQVQALIDGFLLPWELFLHHPFHVGFVSVFPV